MFSYISQQNYNNINILWCKAGVFYDILTVIGRSLRAKSYKKLLFCA